MRRPALLALVLIAVAALSYALAQQLPPGVDPGKPATWFLTAAGWGGMVVLILEFVKANVMPLKGFSAVLASFVLSVGGSLVASTGVLSVLGIHLMMTTGEAFTWGITAFFASSGGWDFSVGVVKAAKK